MSIKLVANAHKPFKSKRNRRAGNSNEIKTTRSHFEWYFILFFSNFFIFFFFFLARNRFGCYFQYFRLLAFAAFCISKEAGISFHKVKTVNLYHVATTGLTDFAFSTDLRLPSFEIEI